MAAAYVGPGAGLSLLGAVWALLAAVFAALGFVILWPLRRFLKKNRADKTAKDAQQREAETPGRRTSGFTDVVGRPPSPGK